MGIFLVLLLGFLLRVLSINQSLWIDEATSANLARDFSIPVIITSFSPGDFHPPLYYVALKLWSDLFGTSAVALRSFSVLFGLIGIYYLYVIVRLLFNKKTAILSAILLSTSGLHIYFSQEARMYVPASTLVLITIYFFVKTIKKDRVGDWVGFSIFTALSAMTHYMTIFMVPVFWVYGILNKKKKSWFLKLLASHNILFVSCLLWLPIFVRQLTIGTSAKLSSPVWWTILGKTNFKNALLVPVKFIVGRVSWDNKLLYLIIAVALVSFFGLLIYDAFKKNRKDRNFWFVVLWLSVPFVVSLVFGIWLSVFGYFRLLFILPAFYVLVSLGIMSLSKNLLRLILALTLLINLSLAGFYLINPRFHRENWRNLVSYIKSAENVSRSRTIFVSGRQTEALVYYDSENEIKFGGPELIRDGYRVLWLMRYAQPIFDPKDTVRFDIERMGYTKIGEHDFNGVTVWKYIRL